MVVCIESALSLYLSLRFETKQTQIWVCSESAHTQNSVCAYLELSLPNFHASVCAYSAHTHSVCAYSIWVCFVSNRRLTQIWVCADSIMSMRRLRRILNYEYAHTQRILNLSLRILSAYSIWVCAYSDIFQYAQTQISAFESAHTQNVF